MRWSLVLALVLLVLPNSVSGATQWQENGMPICVVTQDQRTTHTVGDGAGGAFISWFDERNGSGNDDVFVQHVTASGMITPGWQVNGVPVCTAPRSQYVISLLSDGNGGVFLAWEDLRDQFTSYYDIYAGHVLADGTVDPRWPANGLPICTFPNLQGGPRMATDGEGGFFVVWTDERAGGLQNADIYLQRVSASGTLANGWPEGGKGICTAPGTQSVPFLVEDGIGGAFVGWDDARDVSTTGWHPYAVRVTSDGAPFPGWTAGGNPICAVVGDQGFDGLALDGSGGIFVAWVDFRSLPSSDPFSGDIYMQRVTGAGAITPGWPSDGFPVCTTNRKQQALSVAADGSGGLLLAWEDYRSGINSDPYVQRVTGDAALAPGWPVNGLLASNGSGYQERPIVAADGAGGAYLVFDTLTDRYRVYAQHVTGAGSLSPGWPPEGLRLTSLAGSQSEATIVNDGMDGAIAAWTDNRTSDLDIYAQQIAPNGPTAIAISLVSAEAEADHVRLIWFAPDARSLVVSIERRSETTDWQTLGSPEIASDGRLRYEDRNVIAGERYAYRLSYREGAELLYSAETWVEIPRPQFALRGLLPNPAVGELVVSFSLASAASAQLEVYDLHGRLVMAREVGGLGSGPHTMRIAERGVLPAGVYTVRLRQGEQRATTRAVMLR